MKRISLALAGALACLLLASVGTAAAMPTEGIVNSECNTTSNNVIGKKVTIVGRRQERRPVADAVRRMQDRQQGREQAALAADREAEGLRRLPLHPDAS